MIISLIGMSNIGKSHWSKKLESEAGFSRFSVDGLITDKLTNRMGLDINESELSMWMGQPWEERYRENSKLYIDLENQATLELLSNLGNSTNVVIDTSGSFISLPAQTIKLLKDRSEVIYLRADDSLLGEMVERYLSNPKPVYWAEHFQMDNSLDLDGNLAKNFQVLLQARIKKYEVLADRTIEYSDHCSAESSIENLFLKTR
jgi:shikimate kinase